MFCVARVKFGATVPILSADYQNVAGTCRDSAPLGCSKIPHSDRHVLEALASAKQAGPCAWSWMYQVSTGPQQGSISHSSLWVTISCCENEPSSSTSPGALAVKKYPK